MYARLITLCLLCSSLALTTACSSDRDDTVTIEERTITGTVLGTEGEPLVGASVLLLGSTVGTITDATGEFEFRVEDAEPEFEISYVGYASQKVQALGTNTLEVSMQSE